MGEGEGSYDEKRVFLFKAGKGYCTEKIFKVLILESYSTAHEKLPSVLIEEIVIPSGKEDIFEKGIA